MVGLEVFWIYRVLFVVLTGSDNWVTMYSRVWMLFSEVCILGLCEGGDAALITKSGAVAALSSCAGCLVFLVISCAWGCLFLLAGVGLFDLLGTCFILRVVVHEGFVAWEG